MADTAPQDNQTYHGNCHCGAVKFTLTLPTITMINECNCSICFRKNYAWIFPPVGGLVFQEGRGREKMKGYEFGGKSMVHEFCPTCGTGIMGKRHNAPAGMDIAVNVRAINDLDIWSLKVNTFDGAAIEPAYVTHPYTGPEPEAVVENGKLYTGSCHCGGTTMAFKSRGAFSEGKEKVHECNCSICNRDGTSLAYPPASHVAVSTSPSAPLTHYRFGRHYQEHRFCSVCGVPVCTRKLPDVSLEEFSLHPNPIVKEMTPEQLKAIYEKMQNMLPINVRCLDGVEWGSFEVAKGDYKDSPPEYEVPA
ncbi:uncharacterized protein BP5553_06435 [Venustampulla echinocandica]|uniref:CENP-V/GFA domain-containing protein n=1 Tax=Venustampulla echinocandica TaxID=2656787 RepID=A0A370TJX5_9HELO|nr:uncharacterized protein BP5553_06435 [Venustampulla echinocandica]RDL35823.1 hypothetical protein BP5553_06435 [Venustampulla echinocandica]